MTSNIFLLTIFNLFLCLTVFGQNRKFDFSKDKETPIYDPNKCWEKPLLAEKYEVITEKILLKEAHTKKEYIPAKYDTVEIKEVLAEGYMACVLNMPVYEEVEEEVLLKEEERSIEYVPAIYESINEETVSSPALSRWVPDSDGTLVDCKQQPEHTHCKEFDMEQTLVDTPETEEAHVLKAPATFREVVEPVVYKDMRRAVVKEAATVYLQKVPARYRTYKKHELISPATYKEVEIPAEYITVTKQKLVNDFQSAPQKVEVLCKEQITPELIRKIQETLKEMGYDIGNNIDGIFSAKTKQALFQFQKEKHLPVGNLNIWTLAELEVLDNEDDLENIEEEEEMLPPHKMF